ncbi:hypothetical protein L0Y65_03940 [Candidatus Micrarchaeota archaeon]|nr:hypothetical protein [Candidatus Micrarchaeota archaeon]
MAKQSLDFKKMALASFLTIGIGAVLVIVYMIIQLLSLVITDSNNAIIDMVNIAYTILLVPVFFALFFWTGMRAAKNYQFDAVRAGAIAAASFFIIGTIELVLEMVLAAIVVTRPMGAGNIGSPALALASSFFGGAIGMSGIALSAVCGIGILLLGALINFVVGGFGALFALRKSG